ncbi:hypothetical protein OG921_14925 [Aldersonia sp. NBC_00410]|uniref:WXG100-like domain-containing protein n=1 Tax=Aldersonia sp. NBC_00410 TaxID=2975954 RepID=UPI00224F88DE|nr:hypothetical protein [Aldersonia sp. NBC_00410]MCX5044462.1 hypothetical protein [Aldersonia sp. NBC_00410]
MGIEIPGWLRSVASVAVGSDWPDGDETAMRRLADSWVGTASALNQLDGEAAEAMSKALVTIEGDTHDAMADFWRQIGGDGAVGQLIEVCEHLADTLDKGATDIEHAKLMIIAALTILAAELAAAAATLVISLGTSAAAGAAAEAATQVTVRMIIRELVQKLLAQLTMQAAKQLALAAGRHALIGALTQGGLDAGIQGWQAATGRRDDLDMASIGKSALSGAVDEVVSSGVSSGLGGLVPDGAAPLTRMAEHAGVGATAGAAGSVASTAATGDEVNWQTLTSGAVGGGVGGAREGAGGLETTNPPGGHIDSSDATNPAGTQQHSPTPEPAGHGSEPAVTTTPETQSTPTDHAVAAQTPATRDVDTTPSEPVRTGTTEPGPETGGSTDPARTHASSAANTAPPTAPTSAPTSTSTLTPSGETPSGAATSPSAGPTSAPHAPPTAATGAPSSPVPTGFSPSTSSPVTSNPGSSAPPPAAGNPAVAPVHATNAPPAAQSPQPSAGPTARPEVVRPPETPADARQAPARAPEPARAAAMPHVAAVVPLGTDTPRQAAVNGHGGNNGGPPDQPPIGDPSVNGGTPEPRYVDLADGTRHRVWASREQLQALQSRFEAAYAWLADRGLTRDDIQPLLVQEAGWLNGHDRELVHGFRNAFPDLVEGEPLQKVTHEADAEARQNNSTSYHPGSVRGSVTSAADTATLTTPESIFDALALDYDGSPLSPDRPVFAMRFDLDSHDNLHIPDGQLSELAGHGPSFDPGYAYPFTGTGFTASDTHTVPEYFLGEAERMNPGAEMYRIDPDGSETLVAVLSPEKKWIGVVS